MEIDKILFGQLSQTNKINNDFADLDINNDGKINSEDINAAQDSSIKFAIENVLTFVDEESELSEDADINNLEEETNSVISKADEYK